MWHFDNNPWMGDKSNNAPEDFKFDQKNITAVIPLIVEWFFDADTGYKESFVYKTMMKSLDEDEERAKSYAIRLLIHYIGDIHQPLHTLSLVSKDHPLGDKGGNQFPIPNSHGIDNLHAVWDSVIYEFPVNDELPYTKEGWEKLGNEVDGIRKGLKIKAAEYENFDVSAWSQESFEVAASTAYKGVKEGTEIS